jgi:hypothetical protein
MGTRRGYLLNDGAIAITLLEQTPGFRKTVGVGLRAYSTATMTSADLMIVLPLDPDLSPRSSTASFVIEAVSVKPLT